MRWEKLETGGVYWKLGEFEIFLVKTVDMGWYYDILYKSIVIEYGHLDAQHLKSAKGKARRRARKFVRKLCADSFKVARALI